MKKILYGILGILLGFLIYSGLLINMPILAAPDMNKNLEEIENLNLDSYIDTSNIMTMIGYQVFPHDINNRLEAGAFSYGRINPMYFLKIKLDEADNNIGLSSGKKTGSAGRNIYSPKVRPGSSGRNIYLPLNYSNTNPKENNLEDKSRPILNEKNQEKSENTLVSLENRYPKDVEKFLDDHNNRYMVYDNGRVLGYNKESYELEEIDIGKYLDRITREGRLPLDSQYMEISSRFGVRVDPFTGAKGGLTVDETLKLFPFHTGLDLAAAGINNSNVYSVLGGVVDKISLGNTGYGNHIIVDHGGFKTYYAHLSHIRKDLKKGMLLEAGEVIGRVGSTGRSTGPHLHLEFNFGQVAVSPELFFSRDRFIINSRTDYDSLVPIPNLINLSPEEVKINGS